jgi:hypothetical protein
MADYLDGYQTVPDPGTRVPSVPGTETANEGTASGGNKWAKRKFTAGPIDSKSGPGVY